MEPSLTHPPHARHGAPKLLLDPDAHAGAAPVPDGDPGFRCEVVREPGAAASVRTIGELDVGTVPLLAQLVEDLRGDGCRHVVFDLSDLEFLDSTGLRYILTCHAEARRDGFTMALISGPPAVHRVFEITGTATVLPFINL